MKKTRLLVTGSMLGLAMFAALPAYAQDSGEDTEQASDDEEDLEGHGTAEYDHERRWWVVEFDEQGVRHVPAGDRKAVDTFLCVACRLPIGGAKYATVSQPGFACANCGTSALAPYAPPRQTI